MNDSAARMGRHGARRSSRLPLQSLSSVQDPLGLFSGVSVSLLLLATHEEYPVRVSRHQPLSLCRSFFGLIGFCLDGTSHPSGSRSAGKREILSSAIPVP